LYLAVLTGATLNGADLNSARWHGTYVTGVIGYTPPPPPDDDDALF
jgi:hypothetical protein